MKIAMMVRGYLPIPRPRDMIYAPIDLAVSIANGLAKRGHIVDFYAPTGSSIGPANLVTCNLRPLARNQEEFRELLASNEERNHYFPDNWDRYMANAMFGQAAKHRYDILHFHHPEVALPIAGRYLNVPVLYTLHDPVYSWYKEMFELYQTPNQHFVSISNNQRRDAPDLNYAATVYNGVDVSEFAFSDTAEDYLLYAGRIVPEKGVKEAVQIAEETGHRLLIAGPVYDDNRGYFDQYIRPHLSDRILHLGFVERDQLLKYYQKARALLTPIQWEEPFGLTAIEAMSCGTPVISMDRGAIREIVVDKKTGFICKSVGDMIKAVGKIDTIDRHACLERVEQHFGIDTMISNYEATMERVLRQHRLRLFRRTLSPVKLDKVAKTIRRGIKRLDDELSED